HRCRGRASPRRARHQRAVGALGLIRWSAGLLPARAARRLGPRRVPRGWRALGGVGNAMGSSLLRIVSLPFVGLLLVFERLGAVEGQRREYLADLAAARVAGTDSTVRLIASLTSLAGVHTLASAAVRRKEDPFLALDEVAARPPLTWTELAASGERARAADL